MLVMLNFFPTPDEIWYSILCRYHVKSGNEKAATTIGELFNSKTHASMGNFFPNNSIYDIVKQLPEDIFSIQDIVLNHTLFSYFSRIYTYDKKIEMITDIENGRITPPTHVWKTSKAQPELKYCPVCKKEDELIYGESYWHVCHQIPLVYKCLKHNHKLITYRFNRRNQLNEMFILPGDLKNDNTIHTGLCPKQYEDELIKTLNDYQYLPLKVGQTEGHNNLFQELINHGYGSQKGVNVTIDAEKIYQVMVETLGESFIRHIFGDRIYSAVFLRIKNWKLMSPERYAILSVFLGQSANITFSNDPLQDDLTVKINQLKDTGLIYKKKYVADQLGIKKNQLDSLVKSQGIDPFWEKKEQKRTETVKVYLTPEEKQKISQFIRDNQFQNFPCFFRYCVEKYMEEFRNK